MKKQFQLSLLFVIFSFSAFSQARIGITYNHNKEEIDFAIKYLHAYSYRNHKITFLLRDLGQDAEIKVFTQDDISSWTSAGLSSLHFSEISTNGYAYKWSAEKNILYILALDPVGASYGILDLKQEFTKNKTGGYVNEELQNIEERVFEPTMAYRIIKFNLPWSPYRNKEATTLHYETCRDLEFWKGYLDMMVENRFNVLSLWNVHPFSFMIKSENYPLANSFDEAEMAEWQTFWKSLFKMAKQRGIQTFIVNWNIAVSPEFAKAYNVSEYSDLSETVKNYTKESVTQVINEYPNLTGIGVTLADWMGTFDDKMTPQQREDWIEDTFVAGIKAAKRPIKFLHRSVLAGDPMAMRALFDRADLEEPALMEIKFNWSHGHSTPNLAITHDYHSGKLDERFWSPKPENYNIQWMVRNEDFFILRWGQPDFIRDHIKTNSHDYVNGYFIGSEGYIPAKDYSHINSPNKTWKYAFEKQWLFYKTWGHLLYNKATPNSLFINSFEQKFGLKASKPLFKAYELVSKMPLKLASFHRSTWDYTLYSEGFIEAASSSPDGFFDDSSPFISIDELINHETLEPNMLSILDFVRMQNSNESIVESIITPLELADELTEDSQEAISLLTNISDENIVGLKSEIKDAQTWAYLGLYFADKLKAGVALETFRNTGARAEKRKAVSYLENCLNHWQEVVRLTEKRYKPVPHVTTERNINGFEKFSWKNLLPQAERDIQIAKAAVKN